MQNLYSTLIKGLYSARIKTCVRAVSGRYTQRNSGDYRPDKPKRDSLIKFRNCYDPPLDPGIRGAVEILAAGGVETFESCEGGAGHAYPVPTVRFHGERAEGPRALGVAMAAGLPVAELRRVWDINDGEACGPYWEMTFS